MKSYDFDWFLALEWVWKPPGRSLILPWWFLIDSRNLKLWSKFDNCFDRMVAWHFSMMAFSLQIDGIFHDIMMAIFMTEWWHFSWQIDGIFMTEWWHFSWQNDGIFHDRLMAFFDRWSWQIDGIFMTDWWHFSWQIDGIFHDRMIALFMIGWRHCSWLDDGQIALFFYTRSPFMVYYKGADC